MPAERRWYLMYAGYIAHHTSHESQRAVLYSDRIRCASAPLRFTFYVFRKGEHHDSA